MTCETVKLPHGGAAIICGRNRRRPKCSVRDCTAPGDFRCDAPVAGKRSGTCDRYLCAAHRTPQRGRPTMGGIDFCPEHAQAATQRLQQQISLALDE